MAIALVLVSVALVVCLYLLLMRGKDAPVTNNRPSASLEAERPNVSASVDRSSSSGKAEAELEKKRKELDETKKQMGELKDELKAAKKKLYDQKEAGKADDDLVKARAEVERQASIQLEHTRMELAQALEQITKLKADDGKGRKPAPAPVAAVAAAPAVEKPAEPPPQRVIRELSDTDKERITRAEASSSKDRTRLAELEKALKNSKGRADAATHQLKTARSEGQLAKDKFRAIERRVNRLMLERDLMVRAIKDLETKSGISAERVELTADEAAAADQKVNEKQAAEDKAAEEAREKMLVAEAVNVSPAAAEPTPAAAPAEAVPAPAPSTPPAQA